MAARLPRLYEAQARSAEAMLRRAATVEAREIRRSGDGIELVVGVTNQSGHKFPTGYPSRRAFLHVLVTAPDGRVVFESGKTDAYGRLVTSTGALAEAKTFHPHLDVVDREDLVQIYESVPVDNQGKVAHRPLDALRYAKDNRLLPVGFDRRSRFSAYISPVGTDADPGFHHPHGPRGGRGGPRPSGRMLTRAPTKSSWRYGIESPEPACS